MCEQERHAELVRKIGEERREAETAREDARKKQEQVEVRKCMYVVEREGEEKGRRGGGRCFLVFRAAVLMV